MRHSFVASVAAVAALILAGPSGPVAAGQPSAQPAPAPAVAVRAPLIPRSAIFGNPSRSLGRISPDGAWLSWLAPRDGVMNVWVAPTANPEAARALTRETHRGIAQYVWAPDSRHILFIQDVGGNENFRLFSVNVEGGEPRGLTPAQPNVRAEIRGVSRLRPDVVLVGLNNRNPQVFDLHEVNYRTGEMRLVAENPGYADFLVDRQLRPRFGAQESPGGQITIFRRTDAGGWEQAFTIPADDNLTTDLIGFNADGTAFYMIDSRGRNTAALVRVDPATGNSEVLASDPRADIAGIIVDPRTYEPIAYSSNHLRNEWRPIGDAFRADLEFLRSRLPGELAVTAMTNDGRKAVVSAASAEQPAVFYLYDREARTLTRMFDTRPDLADAPLQPMHPIVIPSRDGLDLVSYLTLPPGSDANNDGIPERPVPMVLSVHGGPWSRNLYGYNSTHQWPANRGYAVLSVNYRGSTGFGKSFINAAVGQWSAQMHDDLIDAVDWAVQRGITQRDRVAIIGGSYGGYATLVGLTFTPDRFACGVDIVGPSNLATLIESFPPYWRPFLEGSFIRHVGDPAVPEQRARMMAQSPISRVDRIRVPLLIGQGANDPRVVKAESDQIVAAMRQRGLPVTYLLYPDEGHGFNRPENSTSFNAVAEAFLSRCLGGRFQPIGEDFRGSTIQVLEGADHVPGLREAIGTGTSPPPTSGAGG